jgi:dihydroxy-acid dehydratase
VSDEELARRKSEWKSDNVPPEQRRGYDRLYAAEVSQADEGCDFAFLQPIASQNNSTD